MLFLRWTIRVMFVAWIGGASIARAQSCCLNGDVNRDLLINPTDIPLFVAGVLNPSGAPPVQQCALDANDDGVIDGADVSRFAAILLNPSLARFDYGPAQPNAEAKQIALEMLGSEGALIAPPAVYARVDRDLGLIRAHTPALVGQAHSPKWIATDLIVKKTTGAPDAEYRCLNAYYRLASEQFLFSSGGGNWYTLTFSGSLNPEALAGIYAAAPEIELAEPNGLFGGENAWTPSDLGGGLWQWVVDDGFLDCFDGCDCHKVYTFQVDAGGTVTPLDYFEWGQPWCDF